MSRTPVAHWKVFELPFKVGFYLLFLKRGFPNQFRGQFSALGYIEPQLK